jgi:hypothetical protein
MVGKTVHSSAAESVRYHEQHLSNGDYHLEEGKVQGEFVGALADEWSLSTKAIVKDDARFRAFAELNLARLSGLKLGRPRRSERQAVEFAYSAPKSVGLAAVHDARIAGEMSTAVKEELKWFESFACCRDRRGELCNSEAARKTGKMLAATFLHETSRAKDPSLHMHVLIANVTIDPERKEPRNELRRNVGVGKTYFMERLVRASLDAGRPIVLVAAYDEQSRVTLRAEAEKATRPDVEQAFREANTVAWLLNKARFAPEFRESLRGADIYVDEGSLLDNQTMLGLANLARDIDARVIFQGDTQQLQPVGRGQPLAMLERELGFGMHVGRINVTRRQLRLEDKRLAQELSSGDAVRFSTAIEALIASGAILSGGTDEAVQTILANRNAQKPVDAIVLLSTFREIA